MSAGLLGVLCCCGAWLSVAVCSCCRGGCVFPVGGSNAATPAAACRSHGFSSFTPLGSFAGDERFIRNPSCRWLAEWPAPVTGFYGLA